MRAAEIALGCTDFGGEPVAVAHVRRRLGQISTKPERTGAQARPWLLGFFCFGFKIPHVPPPGCAQSPFCGCGRSNRMVCSYPQKTPALHTNARAMVGPKPTKKPAAIQQISKGLG